MSISEWIILEPASGNISSLWQGTKYKPGLNRHGNAAHIVVYNRYKQILEEEVISPLVLLAMRNMYQTPLGMVMKSTGLYRHLKALPPLFLAGRRGCHTAPVTNGLRAATGCCIPCTPPHKQGTQTYPQKAASSLPLLVTCCCAHRVEVKTVQPIQAFAWLC